jgi:hypothetical protein
MDTFSSDPLLLPCSDPQFLEIINNRDLTSLLRIYAQPSFPDEKLGGKPLLRLDRWTKRCGGADFMRVGMTYDWRDDIPPPHPNTRLFDYIEYKSSPEREAAFDLLLRKEIQEKIVIIFDHSRVRLYNPTF